MTEQWRDSDDKWLEFCKQARAEAVIGALSDLKRDIDENAYDMATVSRIIDKHLNEAKEQTTHTSL